MFSDLTISFPLHHDTSLALDQIRNKTERDYQSQHQKVIVSLERNPSVVVPEYDVGALARDADDTYLRYGHRWTPAEKTRAWVITGIVLSTLLDVGVIFAAVTTGVTEIAFAAIPLTLIGIGGVVYLCTRTPDLDRARDRSTVQRNLTHWSLAEIIKVYTLDNIIGYNLLLDCNNTGLQDLTGFYGRFSRLVNGAETIDNNLVTDTQKINRTFDSLIKPWQTTQIRAQSALDTLRMQRMQPRPQDGRRDEPRTGRQITWDLLKAGAEAAWNVFSEIQLQKAIDEANREIWKWDAERNQHLQKASQPAKQAMQVIETAYENLKAGMRYNYEYTNPTRMLQHAYSGSNVPFHHAVYQEPSAPPLAPGGPNH